MKRILELFADEVLAAFVVWGCVAFSFALGHELPLKPVVFPSAPRVVEARKT